jgi:hypothetical protein
LGDFCLTSLSQLGIALGARRQFFCSLAGFVGLTDETFIRLRWHRRFLVAL